MPLPESTSRTSGFKSTENTIKPYDQGVPGFFGPTDSQLLGVLYKPTTPFRGAILVCHPTGHEYYRSYQAISLISNELCRDGYMVLHFDYFGTGDSNGSTSQCTLKQWQKDIRVAAQYLRAKSSQQTLHLCATRVGALLALASNLCNTNGLTLWDPVLDGSEWLKEQFELQRTATKHLGRFLWTQHQDDSGDLFGYRISTSMSEDLKKLKLKHFAACLPENTKIIRTEFSVSNENFLKRLGPDHSLGKSSILTVTESCHWSSKGYSHSQIDGHIILTSVRSRFDHGKN